MQDTSVAHAGDPIFVRVVDLDRNRDGGVDRNRRRARGGARPPATPKSLRLSETGANTGVFVGYIAHRRRRGAAPTARCRSSAIPELDATYVDPTDNSDAAQADALVDPFGLVFDSQTGAPINGARVRLIDATTGLAATVFGDDGVSRYPSEMVTGQPVTDQGGTQYSTAGGRVPLPAGGAGQLSPRSGAARQLHLPLAAHDRRSADAAERAVPPAAGFVRSDLRGHARRRRWPSTCRSIRPATALRVAQDRGSADRDHRRLRAVHAHAAEHERDGRVQRACR